MPIIENLEFYSLQIGKENATTNNVQDVRLHFVTLDASLLKKIETQAFFSFVRVMNGKVFPVEKM